MVIDDDFFMSLAIAEAWKFQLITYPNPAVGCVIVKNGEIIAIEAHKEAGMPHAEVNAAKAAFLSKNYSTELDCAQTSSQISDFLINNHNDFFKDCDFFVTLEPCNHFGKTPPCALLLEKLQPKRVIIGSIDPNNEASGGITRFKNSNISIKIGVLKKQCDSLLFPFYLQSTNQGIRLFKLAQRLNGTFDGGAITSETTLKYLHKIREKIDSLAIGGNTVRIDRPTLNCRFSNSNKAPNIIIISRQQKFDQTIPLFNIKNRNVSICNNIDILENNQFIMFEGGDNLLNLVYNRINIFLFVVSVSSIGGVCNLKHKYENFEFLGTAQSGDEILIWLKKRI